MNWNDIFETLTAMAIAVLLVEFAVLFPLMALHII